MNNIPQPHKQDNIQAALSIKPPLKNASIELTRIQIAAYELFDLGFNVLPVPSGQKGGWPWKPFQYTRIHPSLLRTAFTDPSNIAIMTGRTSGNLFVIDCETRDTFHEQGELLRRANIPIWSVRSHGTHGGGHYYLRCAEGEIANIRLGEIDKNVEVRGNRCYVVAPPSIHPDDGELYKWGERHGSEPPTVHIEDITWLPLKLAHKPKKNTSPDIPPLSLKTQDFIAHNAPEGERNNRLFAAACDMLGNNYDPDTIRQILTQAGLTCGLTSSEIHSTLRSAFSRPREPARKQQLIETTARPWQHALIWAENQLWSGRTGQTDRAVFLACCERAQAGSNDIFRASVREIAELARVNKETASRALKRLQKAGHIHYRGHDTISRATLWTLSKKVTEDSRSPYTTPPWLGKGVRVSRTDAGEWGALGKTASVVYESLQTHTQPIKPKVLAERHRFSCGQVYRALAKLAKFGMVRRESEGWVAVQVDAQWLDDHIALVSGTLGKGEARKKRHSEERAINAGLWVINFRRKREGWLPPPVVLPKGIYYCGNCGQSTFVVDGMVLPEVCDFCAPNFGWRQGTVWRREPPHAPPRLKQEREKKKHGRRKNKH